MALTAQYLSVYSGASKPFPLVLTQDDGVTVINLATATTVEALFKRNLTDSDGAAAITKTVAGSGITVTNAATGQITISLVPADTAGIESTTILTFAVKAILPGGVEYVGCVGTLAILPSAVGGI